MLVGARQRTRESAGGSELAPPRRHSARSEDALWALAPAALATLALLLLVHALLLGGSGGAPSVVAGSRPRVRAAGLQALQLAARAPVSAALGADDARYHLTAAKGQLRAANPAQQLLASFSSSGVTVGSGGHSLRISLAGIGRGGDLGSPGRAVPRAAGANAVSYALAGVQESFANGPLGLEQRFTLMRAPRARAGGALALEVAVSGAVRERLVRGGEAALTLPGGRVLRYGGLRVSDARGRVLPARLSLVRGGLLITVADGGAAYPLHVDPFVQKAELAGEGLTPENDYGFSVAISGETIAIGAEGQTVAGKAGAGAVYVFSEPKAGWEDATQTAELSASDAGAYDELGHSVGISGETIVAGAPDHANEGAPPGSAYVFSKAGSHWSDAHQTAELTLTGPAVNVSFASSVAISGDTIVAGAPEQTPLESRYAGAVYAFVEPPSGWVNAKPTARLVASDGEEGDQLGWTVAISGQSVVAGAPFRDESRGAVYLFEEPSKGWANTTQKAELTASDEIEGFLGLSLAFSGNTVAAGAPYEYPGNVYVWEEPKGGWRNAGQNATLSAPASEEYSFGFSVTVSGQTIIAGSTPFETTQSPAFVFTEPDGGWSNEGAVEELEPTGGAGNEFGASLALSGNTLVAGQPDDFTEDGSGGAFVFSEGESAKPEVVAELGRCVNAASSTAGAYLDGACTKPAGGGGGPYEFQAGAAKARFSGSGGSNTIEAGHKQKIKCKSVTASGEYVGQYYDFSSIELTGCGHGSPRKGQKCQSPGQPSGQILSSAPLVGQFSSSVPGTALLAVTSTGETIFHFTCTSVSDGADALPAGSSEEFSVTGSITASVSPTDKPAAKMKTRKAKTKAKTKAKGAPAAESGEAASLAISMTIANEEALEIKTKG